MLSQGHSKLDILVALSKFNHNPRPRSDVADIMLSNLTIKTRLIGVISLLAIELIVGAAVGLVNLRRANDEMNSLYSDRLVCLGQLDKVVRAMNLSQLALAESLTAPVEEKGSLLKEIADHKNAINVQWLGYRGRKLEPGEARLANDFEHSWAEYVQNALNPTISAMQANEVSKATELEHGKMRTLFLPR